MTTISLDDRQLIAIFDGLQLLTSKLYADAGLHMSHPVMCSHLLEQIYPHVVQAMQRQIIADQSRAGQSQPPDYTGQ